VAERESTEQASAEVPANAPSAAELLRATLEKIVFFEWQVRELSAELAAAQSRAAASELSLSRAEEASRAAVAQTQAVRAQVVELETERTRLASLLARPHAPPDLQGSKAALEAERARSAQLAARLEEAQAQVARNRDERNRWLNEMIEQARAGDEAPAALAQFISELRGEVIALRERQKQADAQLAAAGLQVAPPANSQPPVPAPVPRREPDAIETARTLWDEGRLGTPGLARMELARAASPAGASSAIGASREGASREGATRRDGSAALALAEQCLRGLASFDAGRRAQAARNLLALPVAAAAPALATALGTETDPKARAAIARALVACGGETAAEMVARLIAPTEPALVRLAALESLALLGGERGSAALEAAALDPAPSLRRRAAALARELGGHARTLSRLTADASASVRSAAREPREDLAALPTAAAVRSVSPGGNGAKARSTTPDARPTPAAHAAHRDMRADALHAIRTAIFGLSEDELAAAVGLSVEDAATLVAQMVATGFLVRRGRRLIAGPAAEAAAARAQESSVSELNAGRGA
jgi:chromosome segregation protein